MIIQTVLAPGQMGNSASWEGATKRAQDLGAALIIGIWGYGGNLAVWQSANAFQMVRNADGTSRYVNERVTTPAFFMGFEDGRRLRDLVAAGEPVTVSARVETETREGLVSPSIFGTLPGTTDETIYVMAHMDGYYDAALDNASGMAVMMGLAEYFAHVPAEERRRTITFIGTAGHHVGSPNAPYLRDQGLLEKTALMLNCEHIAPTQFVAFNTELRLTNTVSPRRWWVHGSQRLLDITPRRLPHLRGQRHRRDGRPGHRGDDGDRQGGAVGAAHPVARAQAHRRRRTGAGACGRGRGGGAGVCERIVDQVNTLDLDELQPARRMSSR